MKNDHDYEEIPRSNLGNCFYSICLKHVNVKKQKLGARGPEDVENPSMLEMLLRTQGGEKTAITMSIDLLSGGIDTVKYKKTGIEKV